MQTSFARIPFALVTLAASLLACSSEEPNDGVMNNVVTNPTSSTGNMSCPSQDGAWIYENCQNLSGPCHRADNTRQRTNCMDPSTETCNGMACAPGTVDTSVPMPNPTVAPPVGMPTGSATGQVPPPGTNPVPTLNGTTPVPTGSAPPVGTDTVPPTPGTMPPGPVDTTVPPTDTSMPPTDPPPTGTDPAGYWRQDDWAGCAWTGIDDQMAGTTITPQDFLSGPTDGAYCVSGSVAPTEKWLGVALLGFNLGQDAATADCSYAEVDPNSEGPPGVQLTGSGIALNFAKRGADTSFTLRVQIQGPNGHKEGEVGDNDRWCSTILEVQGTAFIPWSDFNTQCWEGGDGNDYNGEPISAIVFTVPGNGWETGDAEAQSAAEAVPYDFCVNGFAAGESAADAPMGGVEGGDQMGTLGNETASDRAKVQVDGENYIVQNNAWGDGAGLVLDYVNNSFVVTSATGSGASAPASFPSIYVGANGFTNNGAYTTSTTDNLPIQISAITSIPTTFTWGGNNGSFNAAYDVWFANEDPAGRRYNDGINGFIMVWLAKPSGGQVPIGSDQGDENVAGHNWDVWVGNRGSGPSATEGAEIMSSPDARVVSFVIQGSNINTLSFDLKDFIDVATSKYQFNGAMYLTDVFAGFEIWNGGNGLSVEEFKIDVQ